MDADLSNRVGEADERFVPREARGELIECEHLVRYWWATALAEGRRVLDAGCGVGYGTAMLARAGAAEAIGVDLSAQAIAAAEADSTTSASFLAGDVRALPFQDGAFDLVVCFEVIEHIERPHEVIAELARVLAPGGVLAVSSPNRDVYVPGNPHHVHEYVPAELRAALAERFEYIELRRQHDWVASAVLNDEQVADASLRERDDVRIGKVFGRELDSEAYTLAVASGEPLPEVAGHVALGNVAEIRAWLEELRELRDANGRHEPILAALTLDRDRARQSVAELQDVEAQLRADNTTLLAELERLRTHLRETHGSLSWRVTGPLRRIQRLRR